MKRTRLLSLAATALAAATLASACTGDDGGKGGDARCSEENAHYEGYATDETCVVMLDAEDAGAIQIGGANAAVMLSPTSGGIVATTATSLTLSWDTPLDLDTSFARRAPRPVRTDRTRALRQLAAALSPVSTAWAHEPPVTGAIHMVRLKGIEGHEGVATYFTSLQFLVLTGHGLEHVTGAPEGTVAIEVTSMYVEDNIILNSATDGPFRAAADTVVNIQ